MVSLNQLFTFVLLMSSKSFNVLIFFIGVLILDYFDIIEHSLANFNFSRINAAFLSSLLHKAVQIVSIALTAVFNFLR